MIISLCATYKKANLPMLESLAFKDKQKAIDIIHSLDFVEECVILQTCNRVEIYVTTKNLSTHDAANRLIEFWSNHVGIDVDLLRRIIEIYYGSDALHHLLLLASGLESMVVGEDQILGQVRKAYVESKDIGAAKSFLGTAFIKAVNVGRKVRTETGVNKGAVSISSVAVDFAENHLSDLTSTEVLVIGAGEAGMLAAKELARKGVKSLLLANRTYQKGLILAKNVGAKAVRFNDIYSYLPKVDVAIVATSANTPLLTREKIEHTLNNRKKSSRLLLIDVSQPRCVDEAVGFIPSVDLRNIDDLRNAAERSIQKRLSESAKAELIVLDELKHLEMLMKKKIAEPAVSALCKRVEEIRQKELSKTFRIIKGINEKQRIAIENLTKELTERILQAPIENLRQAALCADDKLFLSVKKLFDLENSSNAQGND